jgi:CelD/BcsL family acetyltransferase involved in cellulose biosynthesis
MHDFTVTLEPAKRAAGLEAAWRDLEDRADGSFFTSWNWIGTWLATIEAAPLLLTVHRQGTVIALALLQPAHLRRLGLQTNALFLNQSGDPAQDIITIERSGILTDRRFTTPAVAAAISHLKHTVLPDAPFGHWDELHCHGVADDFIDHARAAGLMVRPLSRQPSFAVDIDSIRRTGTPYLDTLSSNTRYQIRRALRLYEQRGPISAHAAQTPGELYAYYDDLKVLHQRYWESRGKPGSFSYPFFDRFHRALLSRCGPSGTIEIVRVAAGDSLIGYIYNFIYRGCVYAYQSGLNYEADAKLKPGLVSHYLCIERHLADAHTYDFLAGENRYKRSLSEPRPEISYVILQRRTARSLLESLLRRVRNAGLSLFRTSDTADLGR